MAAIPTISEEAKKVLRALTERASDGYTVLSRTGLNATQLEEAVQNLLDLGLVGVQGEPHGDDIGRVYLWVPPDAQGRADYLLGKLMAY